MPVNTLAPPILRGDTEQQLKQLRDYLMAFHRGLSQAVDALDAGRLSPQGLETLAKAVTEKSGVDRETLSRQTAALKSLILKTADVVYQEMDRITAQLESKYVAISDYGSFTERINTQLSATAGMYEQAIRYYGELTDALADTDNRLASYILETEGYIRQGIVEYDGITPVIGIAIGQNLQVSGRAPGPDGKTYDVIDKKSFLSVLTASKLSFYQGENRVAYLSNNQLYITTAHILEKVELGDNWELGFADGFTIRWVGA